VYRLTWPVFSCIVCCTTIKSGWLFPDWKFVLEMANFGGEENGSMIEHDRW
jgi:hypothetical protein